MSNLVQRICLFAFLAVLLAVGMIDVVFYTIHQKPPGNGTEPGMPFPVLKAKRYWNLQWTTDYEAWLKNRSWLMHGSGAKYRELAFTYAHRTPQNVIVGKNGWLFLPETVESYTGAQYEIKATQTALKLAELKVRYEAIGIELVVLIIPNATTLFPEQMPDWVQHKKERLDFLPVLMTRLQEQKVHTLNAQETMLAAAKNGRQVYFKCDNHWTYQAAQIVAEATTRFIRETLRETDGAGPVYSLSWKHVDWRGGALDRRLGFWNRSPTDMRYADAHEEADFVRLRDGTPVAGWSGTSFSDFGTPEFFANDIGAEVAHYNRNGKGILFTTGWALKHYESHAEPKPKVVVLEIPEYLVTAYSDGSVFDIIFFGAPPWKEGSVPVPYKVAELTNLVSVGKPSAEGFKRRLATDKKVSLVLKLSQPVKDLEVSVSLEKKPSNAIIRVKGIPGSGQICYDGDGLLKYRFTQKRPARQWEILLSDLVPGQIVELGEVRTRTKP